MIKYLLQTNHQTGALSTHRVKGDGVFRLPQRSNCKSNWSSGVTWIGQLVYFFHLMFLYFHHSLVAFSASLLIGSKSLNVELSAFKWMSVAAFSGMSEACREQTINNMTTSTYLHVTYAYLSVIYQKGHFPTSDSLEELKQMKSLILTNSSGFIFSCLHPPKERPETYSHNGSTVDLHHGCLQWKWRKESNASPVIMLTSRPHTTVVRVPKREKYR